MLFDDVEKDVQRAEEFGHFLRLAEQHVRRRRCQPGLRLPIDGVSGVEFARDPAGALGIKPFAVRKLEEQAAGFDERRLRAAYAGLARLDADLKGGSKLAYESPYMAIQRWVLDTCLALPGVDPRTRA